MPDVMNWYSRPTSESMHASEALSLRKLSLLISSVFKERFSDDLWVKCELQSLSVAASGHCYFELSEYDTEHLRKVASMRGTVWRDRYRALKAKFEEQTAQELAAGLNVLLRVRLSYSALYGFSLNVIDIDPSYTLGDIERRRREIMRRLQREGIAERQKQLVLPLLVKRIAIVSSLTAAGYGDFSNQLRDNRGRFYFVTQLFDARMQGAEAEASILSALHAIEIESSHWDVVVILRGGGAVGDLQSLESYNVARAIALFPIPVLTGIGHDRDSTLLDLVAHLSLRTPTAVAQFLIERMESAATRLLEIADSLSDAIGRRIVCQRERLSEMRLAIDSAVRLQLGYKRRFLERWISLRLAPRIDGRLRRERLRLEAGARVFKFAEVRIGRERARLRPMGQVARFIDVRIKCERLRLRSVEQAVRMADPENTLRRGYTVTLREGKIVTRVENLKRGDVLTTRFADGECRSEIK